MLYALRRIRAVAFAFAVLFLPTYILAQAATAVTTGTISGTVTDASGAVIAGAAVNLRSAAGYNRTTPSDATGGFSFDNLPYGSYTLTIKATGFQLSKQQVSVQSPAVVNKTFALSIAAATQTVTVTSNSNDQLHQAAPHILVHRSRLRHHPLQPRCHRRLQRHVPPPRRTL